MSTRLTKSMRDTVVSIIVNYTFNETHDKENEQQEVLFTDTLNDIYGKEDITRINEPYAFPDYWFSTVSDRITVRTKQGFGVNLHSNKTRLKVPNRSKQRDNNTYYYGSMVSSTELSERLEAFAQGQEDLKKKKNELRRTMEALVNKVTTLKRLKEVIPSYILENSSLTETFLKWEEQPIPTDLVVSYENVWNKIIADKQAEKLVA